MQRNHQGLIDEPMLNSLESESTFRQMANAAPVCIWTSDPQGNRTWFNQQWFDFTGRSMADETGDGWSEGVHPDDLEYCLRDYHEALKSRQTYQTEYRLRHKDGKYHWMLVRATPQFDLNDNYKGFIGTCTDITDRKLAEQVLTRRSRESTALFHLAHELNLAKSLTEVCDAAINNIMSALGCDRASLLLFEDNHEMEFVAWHNLSVEYRNATAGHSPWQKSDIDATPIFVEDIAYSTFEESLLSVIQSEGIVALGFIPLVGESGLIGKFMVYFDEPHEFSTQELELALTVSRQITIGILRAQAEKELFESEQDLRLALHAGRMGTWEWSLNTTKVIWSESLERIYGFEPGTFPGTLEAYLSRIHPDDVPQARESILEDLSNSNVHDVEHRIVWPDGSVHWVEGRGQIIRGANGQPTGMKGVCSDITNRKKAELDAKFLADASAALASHSDEISMLKNIAELAVPNFADWCSIDILNGDDEVSRVAVSHKDPLKIQLAYELREKYPPRENDTTTTVLKTGKPIMVSEITPALVDSLTHEEELKKIVGDLGLRSFIAVPLIIRGKPLGVLGFVAAESGRTYDADDLAIAEDLANRVSVALENVRLYHELVQVDKRKDHFLATLAHELRNPLAPIQYALDMYDRASGSPELQNDARQTIGRHVSHMVRLVDDLLDVSRITQGKLALRKSIAELEPIVHQAIETAMPLIEGKNQELIVNIDKESILLNADAARLAQVFTNLLNNASKFTPREGKIEINGGRHGSDMILSIRDNGRGISPDILPNIFEMFVQADHSLERAQTGLGIGLSLVDWIVTMHGGTVQANSEGTDQGSEFIVTLPLAVSRASDDIEPTAEIQSKGPDDARKILVVDDNVDAARLLSMILQLMGHEVTTVFDGESAVQTAKAIAPHLVFMDIGLPILNGYEAARIIKDAPWGEKICLIALTGWGQDEDRQQSEEAGFDLHLVKPVRDEELLKAIEMAGK